MRRKRVLFLATLTAATLAGAAAGVDAIHFALSGRTWPLSTQNLVDGLLMGAFFGQLIGLFAATTLLAAARRRSWLFHAGVGATAGAVGVWIPLWILAASSAAC